MNVLLVSQAAAQFTSLFVFALISRWYIAPLLGRLPRSGALTALLWIHVFRYVALQTYSAQHMGFPISDQGLRDIVTGDVGGAILALLAIIALRLRWRLGLFLAAILAGETAFDTFANIRGGMQEHLLGAASGPTWFVLTFYVPAVVVSTILIVWQLVLRWDEPLAARQLTVVGVAR